VSIPSYKVDIHIHAVKTTPVVEILEEITNKLRLGATDCSFRSRAVDFEFHVVDLGGDD